MEIKTTPTMQPTDPRLEEIKKLESADAIKTTKSYAGLTRFTFEKDAMQFRPSIVPFIFALAFGSMILLMPLLANILNGSHTGSHLGGLISTGILVLLALFICIRHFHAQKNAGILIDKSGITLDGTLYPWTDIYATAILERYRSAYLTIVLKDNAPYRLYRLTNFRVFDLSFPITVSKYIEHFKPANFPSNTLS